MVVGGWLLCYDCCVLFSVRCLLIDEFAWCLVLLFSVVLAVVGVGGVLDDGVGVAAVCVVVRVVCVVCCMCCVLFVVS